MLTTSLSPFQEKIQLALCPFRSLLIGASLLFSFPAGTKMFQFPAYFSLSGHSEILGSKFACNSPKLIAACHVLHRLSNRAIHPLASVALFRIDYLGLTLLCTAHWAWHPYREVWGSCLDTCTLWIQMLFTITNDGKTIHTNWRYGWLVV